MPEANVLYSVAAVVVFGLGVWVAVVLKTAKEPWARPAPPPAVEALPAEALPAEAAPAEPAPEEPAADEAKKAET